MKLMEQDIINAICLNIAERKQLQPTQVEVELMWTKTSASPPKSLPKGAAKS